MAVRFLTELRKGVCTPVIDRPVVYKISMVRMYTDTDEFPNEKILNI